MSKQFSFSVMPSVSISRSRFARKSQHKTSLKHGYITPIYVDEVLPGDTRSIDMASLVRLSTPIAPIMDNIYIDYFAFFCPMRILWDHAKEFFGENRESAGIPSTEYKIPVIQYGHGTSIDLGSLADHFGLPLTVAPGSGKSFNINALPFRMYYLIYNEWFRNQNVIAPLAISTDDGETDAVLVNEGKLMVDADAGHADGWTVMKAAKMADYFTKGLPYAQKGQAVSIPLGTTAPIIASSKFIGPDVVSLETGATIYGNTIAQLKAYDRIAVPGSDPATSRWTPGWQSTDSAFDPSTYDSSRVGLKDNRTFSVDLSNATAATINQLRYAFQLQKLLEKDALYGSRYWEILASHFGITAPDASLQRPEYLGGYRQRINIDQVLSTAGAEADTTTKLGMPGANSVTGSKSSLFTKSFTEHGYIMIVAVPRAEHTYGQGINRMWSRSGRYDFYWPVFANLGAQEIKTKELFAGVGAATVGDNEIFAYQESWAEYRYKPSIVSGILRPDATNSLDFWTLADNYSSKPTLGQNFIEEQRTYVDRAIVTGSSQDEYIADFFFEDIAVRPMPVYSIPGLIDHH